MSPAADGFISDVGRALVIAATARRWSAVSLTPSLTAPTGGEDGLRRRSTSAVRTRPLPSSRRRVVRSEPAIAASSRASRGPAASARSTARWRIPSRSPPVSAASPSGVASTSSSTSGRTRRASAPLPVPGGSTSPSPRAGVEQYSSPTQRPSSTSSGGTPASSASSGSARRFAGSSLRSAIPTTTPFTRRRPKGTTSTDPTSTCPIDSGSR